MADFLPWDIIDGNDLIGRLVQENFESVEGKFPVQAKDIFSFFMRNAIWTGAVVPGDALNPDEIFNNATDIAEAIGCLDMRRGMLVQYAGPGSIYVSAGHCFHRSKFKRLECETTEVFGLELDTDALLIPGECVPVAPGATSGLESDDWAYVYAKLDVAGAGPEIRISVEAPVDCDGYGWEHPDNNKLRFIGSIRTLANGDIRPFDRASSGWVYWRTAVAASDYQAGGYGCDNGTALGVATGGTFVPYDDVSFSGYHQGVRHIPASADKCACVGGSDGDSEVLVRPFGDPGEGTLLVLSGSGGDSEMGYAVVPVNGLETTPTQKQTFEINCGNTNSLFDVVGYHEDI